MKLIPDTNHYLVIFVKLDKLAYHNLENLIQVGAIGRSKPNVADSLDTKDIIFLG